MWGRPDFCGRNGFVKKPLGSLPYVIEEPLHCGLLVLYRPEKCGWSEESAEDAVFGEAGFFDFS